MDIVPHEGFTDEREDFSNTDTQLLGKLRDARDEITVDVKVTKRQEPYLDNVIDVDASNYDSSRIALITDDATKLGDRPGIEPDFKPIVEEFNTPKNMEFQTK